MKPRRLVALPVRPTRAQTAVGSLQCRRLLHMNHRRLPSTPLDRIQYQCTTSSFAQQHLTQLYSPRQNSSSTAAARVPKPFAAHSAKPSRPPLSVPSKVAKPPPPTSTRSQPIVSYNKNLNPPSDTYRADLSVPERKRNQNYITYLYHCGRAYLTFYKTGIKRVRSTSKLAKSYRQKKAQSGESILTRAEWQIVRRSRSDLLRLLPFGALVLVFGEWLPLFVIWLTPVVPEACRIPAQTDRVLSKLEGRRRERERRLAIDSARLMQRDRKPGSGLGQTTHSLQRPFTNLAPEKLDMFSLLSVSTKLDAHSWIWDKLFMMPPKPILVWQVKRRLEYLRKDDEMIKRDGGWQGLSKQEVERACIERGYDTIGKNESAMRKSLAGWFGGEKI